MEEPTQELTYEAKIRRSPEFALRESSAHFADSDAVWKTLRALATALDQAGIPYVLVGAMASNQHGYARMTTDVDLIMTREGLEQFRERFVGRGYRPALQGAMQSFRDTDTQVKVEVIIAGGFPGDGQPKPVSFPDPSLALRIKNVSTVPFEKLVELKLASGMSAPYRLKDLADVQEVIHTMNLPFDFGAKLDASVRGEYERLWHIMNDADDPYDEERNINRNK